jgi:cytidylate kinase
MKSKYIITIDGPSGAGKSTASKMLAEKLGYLYLDTGAMYRAAALYAKQKDVDLESAEEVEKLCESLPLELRQKDDKLEILLDGQNVCEAVRTPEMGLAASKVSSYPGVRHGLWKLQRETGGKGGIIAEGRDMGTVVFPDADYKFFLTASSEERGKRRFQELKKKGFPVDLEKITGEIRKRDKDDSSREIAPLRPAADAMQVDSSTMSIEEVVELMLKKIHDSAGEQ